MGGRVVRGGFGGSNHLIASAMSARIVNFKAYLPGGTHISLTRRSQSNRLVELSCLCSAISKAIALAKGLLWPLVRT